ncbi:MAG: tandem-95 repeat protein [Phycisphaeraceae bacterium]|nr:tandem-95 repeat protein [Phycisphaeraceae bacterium]
MGGIRQFGRAAVCAVAAVLASAGVALADTFIVTNTQDSGQGSLRAAIEAANAAAGADVIEFDIPTSDPGFVDAATDFWRISLTSGPLPSIQDAVLIDGWSQRDPTGPGLPIIEINGSALVSGNGLDVQAPNVTVRGLTIVGFPAHGLTIVGGDVVQCWVYGCHIGVDPLGLTAIPNAGDGVLISKGAGQSLIGTNGDGVDDAAERCIISGNMGSGVRMLNTRLDTQIANRVAGCWIGPDISGLLALPNRNGGITLQSAERTIIGTNSTDNGFDAGEGNLISGNNGNGVSIIGRPQTGTTVSGNRIGTDVSGAKPLPNNGDGVLVTDSPSAGEHRVGTALGPDYRAYQANIIAFNRGAGVIITGGVNTAILGNSIYDNDELGIDLAPGGVRGVTLNDAMDADTGPNDLQNFPMIIEVGADGLVRFELHSRPLRSYWVEFFLNRLPDPSELGEGQVFLGGDVFITDLLGNTGERFFMFNPGDFPSLAWVTATATELPPVQTLGGPTTLIGNTSEFSVAVPRDLPPTALPQTVNTPRDTDVTITLEGEDPEMMALSALIDTLPDRGTLLQFGTLDPILAAPAVVTDSQNRVVFRPLPGEIGSPYTTFDFRVDDAMTLSMPATVTINVLAVNDPPSAENDEYTINEDTTLNVGAPGVLSNDTDPNGDDLTAVLETGPAHAQAFTFNADGSFTYTPTLNFNGVDTFTYRAFDGALFSNIATVTINIAPINDPPVAMDDEYTTNEDTTLVVAAPGVLENDSDIDGDALTAVLSAPPAHAAAFALAADGSFTYTPALNFNGVDTFTYRAFDGLAFSNIATVTINIAPINDPPVAVDDNYSTDEDTTLVVAAPGVLFNDSDVDGDALTAQLASGPSNALSFDFNADGSFTYTPAANFNGLDTFTYRAFDGQAFSNTATVRITVNPVNDPPVARCRNVVIDARFECPSFFITVDDIDDGSSDPEDGTNIQRAASFLGPFPIGTTPVTLTVTDSGGLSDSCVANVTVLAIDCQPNGIPDACEQMNGSVDCNGNFVPDECECFWDNGVPPMDGTAVNGQLSHLGGGAPLGAKTAEDFYLRPGEMHRLHKFTGYMLSSSFSQLRRARLEFYHDCNGEPAGEPFAEFSNSVVDAVTPGLGGFDVITYSFDLCDAHLWLEGGKAYWVALFGVTDGQMSDLSYWAVDEASGPHAIAGRPPHKRDGVPTGVWNEYDFGPWYPADECCLGCRNLAFNLRGESCKILWDNGGPNISQGAGGSPSGANRARTSRSADNFVTPPCEAAEICLIQAWIWTNCDPVHGFISIYENDCKMPLNTPLFTAAPTRVIATGQSVTIENQVFQGFCLELEYPNWILHEGRTYWLSAGAHSTGNFTTRSFFANALRACPDSCNILKISPGAKRDIGPTPNAWALTDRDYAFRIAVRLPPAPVPSVDPGLPSPSCIADVDGSGTVDVTDIFHFLSAWFAGCP